MQPSLQKQNIHIHNPQEGGIDTAVLGSAQGHDVRGMIAGSWGTLTAMLSDAVSAWRSILLIRLIPLDVTGFDQAINDKKDL